MKKKTFFTAWQECYDSTSGYSYYWNVDTNEVRWEIPPEYQYYISAVQKQWEEYHRALYSNQYESLTQTINPKCSPNQNLAPVRSTSLKVNNVQNSSAQNSLNRGSLLQRKSTQPLSNKTPPPGKTKKTRPSHLSESDDEYVIINILCIFNYIYF